MMIEGDGTAPLLSTIADFAASDGLRREAKNAVFRKRRYGHAARWLVSRLDTPASAVFTNLVVLSTTTNLTFLLISALIDVHHASLWFICLSASSFLFVSDMGVSYPLSRYLARQRERAEPQSLGRSASGVLRFFIRTSAIPFVALAFGLALYMSYARYRSGVPQDIGILLSMWLLVCGYMTLTVLAKYLQMVNEGLGKLKNERYIVATAQISMFLVLAALLAVTRSIWVVPPVYIVGYVVQAFALFRSAAGGGETPVCVDAADMNGLRGESRSLWLMSVLTVVSQNVQVMSLAFLSAPASIASFFFLQRLSGGVSNLIGIIAILDRARITHHVAGGRNEDAIAVIYRNLRMVSFAALFCGSCFFIGIYVIGIFSIVKFAIAIPLVLLFTVDIVFSSTIGVMAQYLLAVGRNPMIPWVTACCIATVALQCVMVPLYGSLGAIGAFLMAQMCTTYVANIIYFRILIQDLRNGTISPPSPAVSL